MTPSISGANAAYTLAVDGTATTVTLVASDPEGLPITYSIASDTSGNTATVSQGVGEIQMYLQLHLLQIKLTQAHLLLLSVLLME